MPEASQSQHPAPCNAGRTGCVVRERCCRKKGTVFCIPFPSRCLRKLASSPDHLICLEKELRRKREAQRLGGLEIDDELKPHRLLHWQVGRRGTTQNFVDVGGNAL